MARNSYARKSPLWLAVGLSALALAIGAAALAIVFLPPSAHMPKGPSSPPLSQETGLNLRPLVEPKAGSTRPMVAIVIDDLGNNIAATRSAIALPPAVALAFLPYPAATPMLARDAGRADHEILVHVPMQAVGPQDPGPMTLRTDLPREENLRRLEWDLGRVAGFSGINNHEGSKFTADAAALAPLMADLAEHHAFFFDSRTTAQTQVVRIAGAHGVLSAERDVFLDDVPTASAIHRQLVQLEAKALQNGVAIAIGHPNPLTLDAVGNWTRTERTVALVPLREALELKSRSLSLARR